MGFFYIFRYLFLKIFWTIIIFQSFIRFRTGKHYLSWKYNKALCNPFIEARELDESGIGFVNGSDFVRLLDASSLTHNDNFCLEAPWFHYRDGNHYLFYSANWYDSLDYYTGVARSSSGFLGPYQRMNKTFLQVDKVRNQSIHFSVLPFYKNKYQVQCAWCMVAK